MLLNSLVLSRMLLDPRCMRNAWNAHTLFAGHSEYSVIDLIRSGLHVIKNDRIVCHDGQFIINSFLPPINSVAFNSVINAVPGKGNEKFTYHIQAKRKAPISLYIACTARCMYDCWHCSAAKRGESVDLSTDQLVSIVKQAQEMGVAIIGFTGGEPLLRDDLETIIQHIDQRSVSFIFSTGYNLTYMRAQKLKEAGLLGIAISVDATDADEHDAGRGFSGAFKHALQAIDNAKRAGLYTMTQTVASRKLLEGNRLETLAIKMKGIGVDEMRIIEPLPCGKLNNERDTMLDPSEMQYLIDFHIHANHNRSFPKVSVFAYFESSDQFGCGAGVQHSYIDHYGNLYPCDFVPISFGNVQKVPLADLWEAMHERIGVPGSTCLAKCAIKEAAKEYPISAETLTACQLHSSEKLPHFYQLLRGR